MAKKATILTDLSAFLKSDDILHGSKEFSTEIETDFFQKKPTALVAVETENKEVVKSGVQDIPQSLASLEQIIQQYAKENSLSMEDVFLKLQTKKSVQSTNMNFFESLLLLQKNYFEFLLELQRSFLRV